MAPMAFRDLSIKYKLMIVTAALLLLVAVSIVFFFPRRQEAQAGKFQSQKALAIARIMASSSEAGLNFGDASAVKETLKSLKEIEDVQFAIVFDGSGNPFAQYRGANATPFLSLIRNQLAADKSNAGDAGNAPRSGNPSRARAARVQFLSSDTHLIAIAPILSNGKLMGSVALGIDQKGLQQEVADSRKWTLVAGLLILCLGTLIFSTMASRIVQPLKQLEMAARRIVRGDVNFQIDIQQAD